ncbi:MAG: hypothetical protein KJ893_00065 [Candidatus Omnitrophica bacterium]|nr:hypothetical protein [Candidatus Omnitrophota bacterium]
MVIHKKNTSKKKDKNWFTFAMGLSHHLFSDYISLKFIYQSEPLTFAPTNFVGMVEVVEKSFKLFLAMQEKLGNSLSHYSSNYGHNIEKLRAQAEKFNKIFADEDVKQFTRVFDDKSGALYQHLRYGSQQTIEGFKTKLGQLIPIVDKIFYNCILRLEENDKKMINSSSLLYFMITKSQFDQSSNRELLLQAVQLNNSYYTEYVRYCETLEQEQKKIIEQIIK